MNSYKPKLRSPRNMRANCLRTLRKGCAQSETLYTDCGTAQHTGGHPSSAVCRPPRPGLQTDAARGVPTVAGPHGATYAGPNFGPLQTTWFRRMPPNAPSPVAQTGAYGRASHGLWGQWAALGVRPTGGPHNGAHGPRYGPPTGACGRFCMAMGPKGNLGISQHQRRPQPGLRPRPARTKRPRVKALRWHPAATGRGLGRAVRRLSLAAGWQAVSKIVVVVPFPATPR